jgi:hypothetical protein
MLSSFVSGGLDPASTASNRHFAKAGTQHKVHHLLSTSQGQVPDLRFRVGDEADVRLGEFFSRLQQPR